MEVDIRKFFDTLDHAHLRGFIRHRVCDGVLRRLIGKWLKAGVLEEGAVTYPAAGSPQGGVISPVLSNIFLHYVLDEWMEQVVKPRLRGKAFLIRYADDFVMGFTHGQRRTAGAGGLAAATGQIRLSDSSRPRRAVVNRCVKGTRRRPLLPFRYHTSFQRATFSTRCGALSFLKLISATIMVFQIKQVALTCDLNRLEAAVL